MKIGAIYLATGKTHNCLKPKNPWKFSIFFDMSFSALVVMKGLPRTSLLLVDYIGMLDKGCQVSNVMWIQIYSGCTSWRVLNTTLEHKFGRLSPYQVLAGLFFLAKI